MAFGVKHFESITASIVNWFAGNNNVITDFNVGSRIRTIFESVAIELEQIYYQLFIGISDGIRTAVYDSFEFPLLQPRAASGTVTLSRATPAPVGGVTIPAGTSVSNQASPAIVFETTDTVVILEATTSIDALTVCTTVGTDGNAPAGTINTLIGAPPGVEDVTNAAAFFTGRDLETEDQRRTRFLKYIANLSRATLGAIENSALGVDNVIDAVAYDSPKLNVFVFQYPLTSYTDISFDANLPSGQPQPILPAAVSVNDALYIGADARFSIIKADMDIGNVGGTFIWEYWNGSAWAGLSVTSDSTDFMRQSGNLAFVKPTIWRDTKVNDIRKYWIRLRVTAATVSQTGRVIELKADPLPGVVKLVAMDASATLPPSLYTSVANAVEDYSAAGIRVGVYAPTITYIDVTVDIFAEPLADAVALKALLEQNITDLIATFSLGKKFIRSEMIQFIENQSTDILNTFLLAPTEDIDTSFDEILKAGTILVTIQQ